MRLTMIRHPQTSANEKRIIYGRRDYPYTAKGEYQFDKVLDLLRTLLPPGEVERENLRILSSPLGRAGKLAEAIGSLYSAPVLKDHNLSEMNFGVLEGLRASEAKEKYPKVYDDFMNRFMETKIPEGESYQAFEVRIDHMVKEIRSIYEPEDQEVIIVSHGGVIRELLERLVELNPGDSWNFIVGNGSIIQLVDIQGSFKIKQVINI